MAIWPRPPEQDDVHWSDRKDNVLRVGSEPVTMVIVPSGATEREIVADVDSFCLNSDTV